MKQGYLALLLGLIACAPAWPADAQTPPTAPQLSYYPPSSITPISFSATTGSGSSPVALPANQLHYPGVGFMNVGAQEAFCKLGGSGVTVSTASYQFEVPAGGFRAAWDATDGYVVCVTATSTATLRISQTNGAPLVNGPGGSGGGGGPTANVDIIGPIGQTAMASAVSVVLASDQTSIPVTVASLPLPTGAATAALQTSGNASLTTIATNSGTQATAANQTAVQGSKSGGTAAASALLDGAIFLTSRPTLTNGQQAALQMDSATNLFVNCAVGCNGSNGSVSATGSAVPASATYLGASVAGTLTGLVATANGLKVDGSAVTQPISCAACATSANQATEIASLATIATNTTTLAGAVNTALPAGSNIVGNFRIDQTTPGTTNGVALEQIGSTTILGGNGASGAGAQRMSISNDNSAIANWGLGAVGSAAPSGAQLAGTYSSGNMAGLIQADGSLPIDIATATTTQLLALSSGKRILITAVDFLAAGTGGITFEYGTGLNCGTGTTKLAGKYSLTAQSGMTKGSGIGPVWVIPASNAFCALTDANIQISGSFGYTQEP